ncbi:MAG: hypothetical protein NTX52_13590, partial [Planctomycetota bacterium]|nr:hypothetical protein [Planctomycetota bacterium]
MEPGEINKVNGTQTNGEYVRKSTVERLRSGREQSGPHSKEKESLMRHGHQSNDNISQFRALALANSVVFWVLFQVLIPLLLIGLPVLWFQFRKGIEGTFENLIGKG